MDVAVIMGSESDMLKMDKASKILKEFKVAHKVSVISAHRAPGVLKAHIESCEKAGAKVFIAGAGMAAHLGGVIASHTARPVIGVPLCASLNGLDSLLSTVQMPKEVPVATVAIDNAVNAAILAAQIIAVGDNKLLKVLRNRKTQLEIKAKKLNK
ncbi:MAG: 5-(carboxyamino)imidazole ribonucleotide mutase [Elusimicrobiota bacterium]|nr:5-(carboxyamino)imidazole ribonucleotide mutase [Elusimicrobiota bacterium]